MFDVVDLYMVASLLVPPALLELVTVTMSQPNHVGFIFGYHNVRNPWVTAINIAIELQRCCCCVMGSGGSWCKLASFNSLQGLDASKYFRHMNYQPSTSILLHPQMYTGWACSGISGQEKRIT